MAGRILIVGDVITDRIMLRARLAESLGQVSTAPRRQALDAVRNDRTALVIFDLSDPVSGGLDLIGALRADPALSSLQILALLPCDRAGLRHRALDAGADDALSHPFDTPHLLARLRSLFRLRNRGDDLGAGVLAVMGLADPTQPWDPCGTVALVADRAETAERWRDALGPLIRDRLEVMRPDGVLAGAGLDGLPADVFVVSLDPRQPAPGLRLIADLRARAGARRGGIFGVLSGPAPEAEIAALDLGATAVIAAPLDPAELALRLRRELSHQARIDRLRRQVSDGLRMAHTDPLTGLPNRRCGLSHLARTLAAGRSCAVLLLDLDRFKQVNDTHGHAAGDAVLAEIGRRLAGAVRLGDTIARLGGEEFLAILPDTPADTARATAERLRAVIGTVPVLLPGGDTLPITVSIGVAVSPAQGTDPAGLLAAADRALYASKAQGRDRTTLAIPAA